jgi:hypothetical protein
VRLAYEYVARTPADWPLVCAGVAAWPSGRTRVALGGFGEAPWLAMDGPTAHGAEFAAADAYSQAGDAWATAEYRREMAAYADRARPPAPGRAARLSAARLLMKQVWCTR